MFTAMKRLSRLIALCVAALMLALPARAETVVQTPQIRAELSADRTAVTPGESVWVALSFAIKKDWHTYWRTPGDSGLPATITWTLPEGVTAGEIQWPAPERIPYTGDLMNFGYHDHVVLLTELKVAPTVSAPQDLKLTAEASWLVCADVCIPQDGVFELPLKIGPSQSSMAASVIEEARAQVPQPAPWPVKLSRDGDALTLTAGPGIGADKIVSAAYFPYEEGMIANFAPQALQVADGSLHLIMTPGAKPAPESAGVLTVEREDANGQRKTTGYTLSAAIGGAANANAAETATQAATVTPLGIALILAFFGGIVLNVMPCVLPVLAMKAMSFMSRGTTDAGALRRDGLVYTAGVMTAFAVLVGALLAFRAAGAAVGWGFQLQSPAFVAGLAYVMLALGLNLSGVFNIGGTVGIGQSLAMRGGMSGSFFTGLLAVVVATPCTAPFMGTAIGFALTQSPAEAILVFEALALGLALPYLVLSFAPGVAKRMPRPGPWMDRVKQVLAFPLYGTAAWLVWVLAQQLDAAGLAGALAGLVLVGFAAWLWGIAQKSSTAGQRWSVAGAGVALLLTIALMTALGSRPAATAALTATGNAGAIEPYSQVRLAELRAEGRPVFVNFTAAWCITCLVNERVALSQSDVVDAFKTRNVAYLKGDWTNRNAEISSALKAAGRDGVPLYLYYAPKAAAPEILPQVLTPSLVIEAIAAR